MEKQETQVLRYSINYFKREAKNGHGVANSEGLTADAGGVGLWATKIKRKIWKHHSLV
jgi:hypothetical protein